MRAASAVGLRSAAVITANGRRSLSLLRCRRFAWIEWSSAARCRCGGLHRALHQHNIDGDVSDDMLVRLLVQDAFRPMSAVTTGAPAVTQNEQPREDAAQSSAASVTSSEQGAEGSTLVSSPPLSTPLVCQTCSASSIPTTASPTAQEACTIGLDAVTDARSCHRAAEPFAVVRRVSAAPGVDGVLEWLCMECRAYNSVSASVEACGCCAASAIKSHRSAKPPVRHVALMPAVWVCTHCAHTNDSTSSKARASPAAAADQRSKFWCGHCGNPFGGVQAWTCPVCDHAAPRAATQCPTCYAQRSVQWTCRACHHAPNSIFSRSCSRCGHTRPSRRSNAVRLCLACGESNDVRWELCATCMAPCASTGAVCTSVAVAPTEQQKRDAREAWRRVPDPLLRDPSGFLRSKTVEGVRTLLLPPSASNSSADPSPGSDAHTDSKAPAAEAVAVRRTRAPLPLPDGAWWCTTCNVPQRRNASFCDICLGARNAMQQRAKEAVAQRENRGDAAAPSATAPLTAVGDWRCPYCYQLRGVEVRECCEHQREVPPGYWLCSCCSSTNLKERPVCLGCGRAPSPVAAWTCAGCTHLNRADAAVCGQCGLPPKAPDTVGAATAITSAAAAAPSSSSVICPVCAAPNLADRTACYRCRARLRDFEWQCRICGHGNCDRQAVRCAACESLRTFDLNEEVWVCEVCSSGVYSGGELPVRTHCPTCAAVRAPAAPHFPARWRCACGMYNRARVADCPACGAHRQLAGLDTVVSCPSCFRDTRLDVKEACAHCGGSLGGMFAFFESGVAADSIAVSAHARGVAEGAEEDEDDDVPPEMVDGVAVP